MIQRSRTESPQRRKCAAGFTFLFSVSIPPHSREAEFHVLGIAKLLPQIVAVKRETQYVVSLAMTGLVRG